MTTKIKSNVLRSRQGFTLVELFFVITLIAILVGMLLPAVRSVRGPARRTACANNVRQLGLAALNYESAHMHFPSALGVGGADVEPSPEAAKRMSGLVSLLPFLEQNAMWSEISQPSQFGNVEYPAFPDPVAGDYPPWQWQIEAFLCPSGAFDDIEDAGSKSYAFCIGDRARQIHQGDTVRGIYNANRKTTLGEITDGCSNTIAMAEIASVSGARNAKCEFAINQPIEMLDQPSRCFELLETGSSVRLREDVIVGAKNRGGRWADGAAGIGMFNTILPPNSLNIAIGSDAMSDGLFSAGGFHTGGINAVRADGSVSFIRDDIDTGDLKQPTLLPEQIAKAEGPVPSPYGVWGALGTAAGEEEVDEGW